MVCFVKLHLYLTLKESGNRFSIWPRWVCAPAFLSMPRLDVQIQKSSVRHAQMGQFGRPLANFPRKSSSEIRQSRYDAKFAHVNLLNWTVHGNERTGWSAGKTSMADTWLVLVYVWLVDKLALVSWTYCEVGGEVTQNKCKPDYFQDVLRIYRAAESMMCSAPRPQNSPIEDQESPPQR